jgi:hypothetical protein
MAINELIRRRCNIGPAEVARRRRSAIAFSIPAAIVAVALIALDVRTAARLALFPFAAAAAVTWLQVVHRFCVGFAAHGLENFGSLGEEQNADPALRAADRARLAQLVLEGSAIGAAVTLLFLVLPV